MGATVWLRKINTDGFLTTLHIRTILKQSNVGETPSKSKRKASNLQLNKLLNFTDLLDAIDFLFIIEVILHSYFNSRKV